MKNLFKKIFKKQKEEKKTYSDDFFGTFYDFRFDDQESIRKALDISEDSLEQFCYDTFRNPIYVYLINTLREQAIKHYLDPSRLLDGRNDEQKYRDVISFISGICKFNETIKDYALSKQNFNSNKSNEKRTTHNGYKVIL